MKLGTQTGSLINHLHSCATRGQPTPVVGMGATILGWTDRYPATIVLVDTLKNGDLLVGVKEDRAERTDPNGMSENQCYYYSPNPEARTQCWRFRNGQWQSVRLNERNRWVKAGGNGLRIGEREKYHDYSF